jgi:hypothetical protein
MNKLPDNFNSLYEEIQRLPYGEKSNLSMSKCIDSLTPLIESVILHSFPSIQYDLPLKFEAMQEARIRIWKLLLKGFPKTEKHHNLAAYLSTCIRWGLQDGLRKRHAPQVFNLGYEGISPTQYVGHLITHSEIESSIFLSELKQVVLDRVIDRIRFYDNQFEACVFIAECLINGEIPDVQELETTYNLEGKASFFITFIRVRLRIELYIFRNQFGELAEANWIRWIYRV